MASAAAQESAAGSRPHIPNRETISVDAEAGNVRVIAVAIPASIAGRAAKFHFSSTSDFAVLGLLERSLSSEETKRPLMLSVAVPAGAPAGAITVGIMRFVCESPCGENEIALVVRVLPRTGVRIVAARSALGARAGARTRAEIMISNTGNAAENVSLSLAAPGGWRWRVLAEMPLAIAAGATSIANIELALPGNASEGDYGVLVRATAASGASADFALNVHVSSALMSSRGRTAPMLQTSVAFLHTGGANATAADATLSGEVLTDIWADGQLSWVREGELRGNSVFERALGRQGYSSQPGFLRLRAPQWSAGVGGVSYDGDGIAAASLWGAGANADLFTSSWKGSVLFARPRVMSSSTSERGEGEYLLAQTSHKVGPIWAGVAASSLSDATNSGRSSTSLAADAMIPLNDGSVRLQLGERRAGDEPASLAWLFGANKRAEHWGAGARVAHLPGGSANFARAEDEVTLEGYRQFSDRLTVSGNYWNNRDGVTATSRNAFAGDGWSLSSQIAFGRSGTLLLETRESSYRSSGALAQLGNSARDLSAAWSTTVGAVQGTVGLSRGALTRSTDLGTDLRVRSTADRQGYFASLAAATHFGVWQVDATHDRAGSGAGLPSSQSSIALHADALPIIPGRATGYIEAGSYYLGASHKWLSSQAVGIDVRLGEAYALLFDASRDELRSANLASGRGSPWIISTRLRYSLPLPGHSRGKSNGMVFSDLNGDGVMSAGEKGAAGIIVYVDADKRTTDSKGRFDAGRTTPDRIAVDPSSLPPGMMVAPHSNGDTTRALVQMRIIPTAVVDVQLRLRSMIGIDSSKLRFADALVLLTDSLGRRWTGVPNEKGLLRLDALPPGAYTVSADLARVGEVLILPDVLPIVRVDGEQKSRQVELLLSPRRVRGIAPPPPPFIIRSAGGR